MKQRLAILGTGRLGEALLRAWLSNGVLDAAQVHCTVAHRQRAEELAARYGVRADTDSPAAAAAADVIVVAVKPQSVPVLLADIAEQVRPEQTLISLAAGVSLATLEAALGHVPVVRVMANTPVQVGEAMSVIAAGRHAGPEQLALTEALLSPVGRVLQLDERHLDAVTALSGSGPAYVFLVAEAMIDAGVLLGLPRDVATTLVVQTLGGSAAMLRRGEHPAQLREAVTSPGGTTAAALAVFEERGLRAAILNGVVAAARRSAELGAQG